MLGDAIVYLGIGILSLLPTVDLPLGFSQALGFIQNVIGFVNMFLPITSLAPIVVAIIMIRNFNVVISIVRWVLRLIPFIGG